MAKKMTDSQRLRAIIKEMGLEASFRNPEAEAIREKMNKRNGARASKADAARAQRQGGWNGGKGLGW